MAYRKRVRIADEILVRNQPNTGGYLYYHLDPMGNVQFLLSDTLQGLEKYTYDVFGKPTIKGWQNGEVRSISSYGNRFLFTGREYLYTFGLYDYRHRFYHPGLGQFIQTDPMGLQTEGAKLSAQQAALYTTGGAPEAFSFSELNLYRYCNNDPINGSDPFGLELEVVQSISGGTVTVSNWGAKFTFNASTGTNNMANVAGTTNNGPIPPGAYEIYEREEGMWVGNHQSPAWILDRMDQKKGNDKIDDLSRDQGGGRFGFRLHQELIGAERLGSDGCPVANGDAIKKFKIAAEHTTLGPSRHITSPPDPKNPNAKTDFGNPRRVGIWKVTK